MRCSLSAQRGHGVADALDYGYVAYIVSKESYHTLQHHHIGYLLAAHHIFQYDGVVET